MAMGAAPRRDGDEYRIIGAVISNNEPTFQLGHQHKAKQATLTVQWEDGSWSTLSVKGHWAINGKPEPGGLQISTTMHHQSVEDSTQLGIGDWSIPAPAEILLDIEVRAIGEVTEHRRAQDVHFCSRCGKLVYEDDTAWEHLEGERAMPICGGGCNVA